MTRNSVDLTQPPAPDAPTAPHSASGEAVTTRRPARREEGTTFEASCYTDPLALEHLTGSWRRAVEHFGAWDAPVQLRWTTKFDDVQSFIGLPHHGRTRVRLSVNCHPVTTRMEGGTSRLEDRLAALRRLALDGYPAGVMAELRSWFDHEIAGRLPSCRVLYWT